jgi:hypothetical protein
MGSMAAIHRLLRGLLFGVLLAPLGACTDAQEEQHEMGVAEPEPQLDPTRERFREPMREGIEPPPEHRQPLEFTDQEMRELEARDQRRLETLDPRALEGPQPIPTEKPLPVDEPVPATQDDRPESIDPGEDPLIDPIGESEPQPGRDPAP